MGDLSAHFSRAEFACRCGCGFDVVDAGLLAVLDRVREHFGVPVTINSAARCGDHNLRVGGGSRSQHLLGKAADIVVHGYGPGDVVDILYTLYPDRLGIGRYDSFVHVDSRSKPARWFN